jgi:hypothetical protein
MSTDASQGETRVPGPPRLELPKLAHITIRRVPFEPPKHRHFTSKLRDYRKAIEFRVQTDRPLNLSTAITPVLFVGETMLTEGEQLEKNIYTYLAFEEGKLQPGAAISLAYPHTPAEVRPESKFRYEPPLDN